MKRIITLILFLIMIFCCAGCKNVNIDNESQLDFVLQEPELETESTVTDNIESSKPKTSKKDKNVSSKISANKDKPKSDKSEISKKDKVTSSKTDNTLENENNSESQASNADNVLPKVKYLFENNEVRFSDIINLSNGGYAVAGIRTNENFARSIIQTYDKNLKLVKEYSYEYGYGFLNIASCSDGGFIASAEYYDSIIKLNKNFETQWTAPFRDDRDLAKVESLSQISENCFAVVYSGYDDDYTNGRLYVSLVNEKGDFIKKVELFDINRDLFFSQDIIPDNKGGFYLFASCNETLIYNFPLVAKSYDSNKKLEVVLMHFSSDLNLNWVKTLGGKGEDWVEESAIDSKGNFYIAVGTNSPIKDSFWDMEFNPKYLFRRMLIKLNKKGDLIYKVPLSSGGMGSNQTFGIHIIDNKAYVTGIANYFDGYQNKYKCQQIPFTQAEVEGRLFCVYNACVDSKGKEIHRNIFRCDINDTPCDSVISSNGSIILAGSVSLCDNVFNLPLENGREQMAALFEYK